MNNKSVASLHTALSILGNRKMGTVKADVKIARMLNIVAPIAEPIQRARERITKDILGEADAEKLTPAQIQKLNIAIKAALSEYDEQEAEGDFTLPKWFRLTEDELPKEQKGEKGWENASQLGAVISDLGTVFVFPAEVDSE